MKRILFISTGNSSRSQMAEGIINHHYKGVAEAVSAGVTPTEIHPYAVRVMKEIGIDISGQTVNKPEDFKDEQFDYIITLCDNARENCPVFWTQGEAVHEHINFDNPELFKGSVDHLLQNFRDIRDQIEERLLTFFDRELKNSEKTLA